MNTIFPILSTDRAQIRWEDYINHLTPVENRNGRWYKREDYFAPLGYGGINGSKLRQLLHLISRNQNATGILTGASVLSPQISMGALVAKHYNLPIEVVLGATKPETAGRHENIVIAANAGAQFHFIPVAYNPALQRAVTNLMNDDQHTGYYRLCYGITTADNATPEDIEAFHAVGAPQTQNIPDEVTHLIIPSGSANSTVSILYGIATNPPKNLQQITLIGIGPNRINWIHDRLAAIETATGRNLRDAFTYYYHHNKDQTYLHRQHQGSILLEHYDLHTTKYAAYTDKMPYNLDGIDFHYTYEGKVLTYLKEHPAIAPDFWDGNNNAMMWIVGSRPTLNAMRGNL